MNGRQLKYPIRMKRSPISRRTPLKRVSRKRAALLRERTAVRRYVFERAGFQCEARIDGCTFMPTDVHEILTRARGGSIIDPENCLALCRPCHQFITENPMFAEMNGFVVSQWAGIAEWSAANRAREQFRRRHAD